MRPISHRSPSDGVGICAQLPTGVSRFCHSIRTDGYPEGSPLVFQESQLFQGRQPRDIRHLSHQQRHRSIRFKRCQNGCHPPAQCPVGSGDCRELGLGEVRLELRSSRDIFLFRSTLHGLLIHPLQPLENLGCSQTQRETSILKGNVDGNTQRSFRDPDGIPGLHLALCDTPKRDRGQGKGLCRADHHSMMPDAPRARRMRTTACSMRLRSLPTWVHRSMMGAISISFPARSAFLNCIRSSSFPASVRACSQVNPHHRATFPLVVGFSPAKNAPAFISRQVRTTSATIPPTTGGTLLSVSSFLQLTLFVTE